MGGWDLWFSGSLVLIFRYILCAWRRYRAIFRFCRRPKLDVICPIFGLGGYTFYAHDSDDSDDSMYVRSLENVVSALRTFGGRGFLPGGVVSYTNSIVRARGRRMNCVFVEITDC